MLEAELGRLVRNNVYFASFNKEEYALGETVQDAAGVLKVFARPCEDKGGFVKNKVYAPGRVHRSVYFYPRPFPFTPDSRSLRSQPPLGLDNETVNGRWARYIVWNNHNFRLTRRQMNAISKQHRLDAQDAIDDPEGTFTASIGDFKLPPLGCVKRSLTSPGKRHTTQRDKDAGIYRREWDHAHELFTEFEQPFDTRYDRATHSCSKIDRFLFAIPAAFQRYYQSEGRRHGEPEDWSRRKLSDHAPLAIQFSAFTPKPPNERAIPSWVTKHPTFYTVLDGIFR